VGYITWDGSTAFGRWSLCLGLLSTLLFRGFAYTVTHSFVDGRYHFVRILRPFGKGFVGVEDFSSRAEVDEG
jgi:hypothetical protein